VQVTIEIPDELAKALKADADEIAKLIKRGLAQPLTSDTALAEEVIQFLGQGPSPEKIIAFRPSAESMDRAGALLEKNREGNLSPGERSEIDEICAWNRFFALIKAQARLHLLGAR
jgi:hypothetical protein